MRQTSTIKKSFFYSIAYEILALIIPIATTPYLTRVLGAEQLGTFSYFQSIAQYFYIFIMLGLRNHGTRSIARVRDSKEETSRQFFSIYSLQIICGVIVSSLYFLYCFSWAGNKLVALAFSLYVISAAFDVTWFFWGLEKFKITSIRSSVIRIISAVLIFVLVKERSDTVMYCLIVTGGALLSQLVLVPALIKEIQYVRPSWRDIAVHIKPNLFLFLTVIAVSVFKYMDKIMLGLMANMSEVGFYEAAERIIAVPIAAIVALGNIMLARSTNIMAKSVERNNKVLKASIILAMFLSASMCFGIMGISKEFVPIFYGQEYLICMSLYLILLPSCLFLAFANVVRTQYLLPKKMDGVYVTSAFLGMGINLIINYLLIPHFGACGAAVGTLFSEIVVCIYQVFHVRKEVQLGKLIYVSMPFVISGAIMFSLIYPLDLLLPRSIALVMKIGIGVISYFALLYLISGIFGIKLKEELRNINIT